LPTSTIILDAGHGGNSLGGAYGFRYEKDDNLRLALEVGKYLTEYGYRVEYTRTTDIFLSQIDRVNFANSLRASLLLSFYRMGEELCINEQEVSFEVDSMDSISESIAINIALELRPLGFINYRIVVRTELPILRDTHMPAMTISVGNLKSTYDNYLFDTWFNEIAAGIARGIYSIIPVYS